MAGARDAVASLDDDVIGLALEAATLLSTLRAGSTAAELSLHADRLGAAARDGRQTQDRTWLAAMARSLRHAALYSAARPDLDPAAVAVMDARMAAMGQTQVAIVSKMLADMRRKPNDA